MSDTRSDSRKRPVAVRATGPTGSRATGVRQRHAKSAHRRVVVDWEDSDESTNEEEGGIHAASLIRHRIEQGGAGGAEPFDNNLVADQLRGRLDGERMGPDDKTLAMMRVLEREIRIQMMGQTKRDIAQLMPSKRDSETEHVATQALASERKTLALQGSSRWKPGVVHLMMQSSCLRVVGIDPGCKPLATRDAPIEDVDGAARTQTSSHQMQHRCDVCGQVEACNELAIDIAGPAVPAFAFCASAKHMVNAYDVFHTEYVRTYAEFDTPFCAEDAELPANDLGRIYAGSTCFRQLVLSWLSAHTINTWIYNAHHELDRRSRLPGGLPNDEYVCALPHAAKSFAKSTAVLKAATAGDGSARYLSTLEIDENFFLSIDMQRKTAGNRLMGRALTGKLCEQALVDLLHGRMHDALHHVMKGGPNSLRRFIKKNSGEEEDEEDEQDEEDEEGEEDEQDKEDKEDEESIDEDDLSSSSSDGAGASNGKYEVYVRKRRRCVLYEDGDDEGGDDTRIKQVAPPAPPASPNNNKAEPLRLALCMASAHVHREMARLLTISIEQLGPIHALSNGLCSALPMTNALNRTLHDACDWSDVLDTTALAHELAFEVSALRKAMYVLADIYPVLVRRPRGEAVYAPLSALIGCVDKLLQNTEQATMADGCMVHP